MLRWHYSIHQIKSAIPWLKVLLTKFGQIASYCSWIIKLGCIGVMVGHFIRSGVLSIWVTNIGDIYNCARLIIQGRSILESVCHEWELKERCGSKCDCIQLPCQNISIKCLGQWSGAAWEGWRSIDPIPYWQILHRIHHDLSHYLSLLHGWKYIISASNPIDRLKRSAQQFLSRGGTLGQFGCIGHQAERDIYGELGQCGAGF